MNEKGDWADFDTKIDGIRPVDPEFKQLAEYAKAHGFPVYQCSWDYDYERRVQSPPRPLDLLVPDEPVWLNVNGRRLWPLKDGRVMSISGWGDRFEFRWNP